MTGAEISKLLDLQGKCSHNLPNKQLFRKLATKLLREVAALIDDHSEVAYNEAGVACSGDAMLHGDHIYVSFNADGLSSRLGIMYRTCKGKKDSTGGPNNWFRYNRLAEDGVAGFARAILDLIDPRHECPRCCKTNTELREKGTKVFCRECNQLTWILGESTGRELRHTTVAEFPADSNTVIPLDAYFSCDKPPKHNITFQSSVVKGPGE